MATINPRVDQDKNVIGWQAIIRKRGFPSQTKTFRTKRDAESWAKIIESEMVRGVFIQRNDAERTLLSDALSRYMQEVTALKRGATQEMSHIQTLLASSLAKQSLASIGSREVSRYRDARLKVVSASTVNRELNILSHMFTVAMQDWGVGLPAGNPVAATRRPKVDDLRNRRLVGDEENRLLEWAEKAEQEDGSMPIAHIIRFALETGMRRGELAAMRWEHADLKSRVLLVTETKTGEPRRVPMSSRALAVLNALPRHLDGKVWGQVHAASISRAFARACHRANIENLRFHDLRHEATSRFFEKGLNPMQVAAITGHKTLQMLKRYTHLRAEDLAKMLG
ncbi:MAG: site-specific integrase [Rhizomicrobium sp.]